MAIKIDSNMSAVAHHIIDGPVDFPYAIDAHSAVSRFPNEWKMTPWSAADSAAAREKSGVLDESGPLTVEDQAALDEHNKAVTEAAERLAAYHAKKEAERQETEQVARDEAIIHSSPPRPAIPRPFGRKGSPTEAEIEAHNKREAKKADDERLAREKADLDKQSDPNAKPTF